MNGLPTEEDVLAVLVLWACRPVVTNIYDSTQVAERNAYDKARWFNVRPVVAELASERRRGVESLEIAIADSERRLEVEQSERAVLDAAEGYFAGAPSDGGVLGALTRLHAARRAVR